MALEECCECGAPTGRAGRGEDSLYASDFGPFCENCWDDLPENLAETIYAKSAEIERLTQLVAAADAPKVKPMVWKAHNEIGHGRTHYGSGVFGHWYAVSRSGRGLWHCITHIGGKVVELGYFDSLEAAKAAAQADYEARILGALE